MRPLPNFVLALTALTLLVANWAVAHCRSLVPSTKDKVKLEYHDAGKELTPSSGPALSPEQKPDQPSAGKPEPGIFKWAALEVSDYKEYVQRLKSVGFPAELVREIVIADMNKLYQAREKALEQQQVPYDAPMNQRQSANIRPEDWQRVKQLHDLRLEKQMALENALGEYVPREILRTPISRNYEAYEYAISQLPPDKRNLAQDVQETEIFVEGYNKITISDPSAELESFKRTRAERDQGLLKILTPEEFERYEMNTTPAGTELARRVIGMQPTDEEFQGMFRIAYKNWLDTGGVYGRWREMPVAQDQIEAANREMNDRLSEALGPERFIDYQMAISETGQQLRNFAARFDLPREVMVQAFQLQTSPVQSNDMQAQLQQLLGPELYQNWLAGRNLRPNLDP